MTSHYSEDEAVLKPAGHRLKSLGWDLVYAWNEEELGQYGTLAQNMVRMLPAASRLGFTGNFATTGIPRLRSLRALRALRSG